MLPHEGIEIVNWCIAGGWNRNEQCKRDSRTGKNLLKNTQTLLGSSNKQSTELCFKWNSYTVYIMKNANSTHVYENRLPEVSFVNIIIHQTNSVL